MVASFHLDTENKQFYLEARAEGRHMRGGAAGWRGAGVAPDPADPADGRSADVDQPNAKRRLTGQRCKPTTALTKQIARESPQPIPRSPRQCWIPDELPVARPASYTDMVACSIKRRRPLLRAFLCREDQDQQLHSDAPLICSHHLTLQL
eukprot:365278-Chlamydomonas_euryale.AAC.8